MQLRSQAQPNVTQQLAYYLPISILCGLIGGVLFTSVGSLVDEDTGVLLFFFGLPMIVGVSFVVIVAICKRLYQQDISKDMLRRAGLLAAALAGVLAVCLPRILMSFGAMLPSSMLALISNWMVVCIWVAALLISSVLFPILIRRK